MENNVRHTSALYNGCMVQYLDEYDEEDTGIVVLNTPTHIYVLPFPNMEKTEEGKYVPVCTVDKIAVEKIVCTFQYTDKGKWEQIY